MGNIPSLSELLMTEKVKVPRHQQKIMLLIADNNNQEQLKYLN